MLSLFFFIHDFIFTSPQVGGVDISLASHEQAVAAIRTAKSPVRFVVKGLAPRQSQDSPQNSISVSVFLISVFLQ